MKPQAPCLALSWKDNPEFAVPGMSLILNL